MNMEKIILELMGRIQICEEGLSKANKEILELKKNLLVKEDMITENKNINKKSISRNSIRKSVIEEIRSKLTFPGIDIRVGNREEGSGIVISKNGKNIYYKFYYSKTYNEVTEKKIISWSGIMNKDINSYYRGYIFAIVDEKKVYILIFTYEQMIELIKHSNKEVDSKGKYHFSFEIVDGKFVKEVRGSKHIDVSYSLENYDSIYEEGLKFE